jgi:hypothetical protein
MRVAKLILVVEPGTGRTGKLAMVAYQFQQVADVAFSEQRILPAKRVRKPSDCLVPCLASKLVINSALLMARKAMTVPADRTPLLGEQSFHLSLELRMRQTL